MKSIHDQLPLGVIMHVVCLFATRKEITIYVCFVFIQCMPPGRRK